MRSLVLKDLYNIGHNAKQMLILLLFLAVCMITTSGAEGFIVTSVILCSMMTITTFSFDERCKWEKYALIMPVTRKEYVIGKYVVNLIFVVAGLVIGFIVALIVGLWKSNFSPLQVGGSIIVALFLALFYGSITIPLIIKYGTESARIIMIAAIAVPGVIAYSLYKLVDIMNIHFTDMQLAAIIGMVGVIIIILAAVSIQISVKWFEKKEF